MQLILTLRPEKELMIPFNYNHQLQSAIYAKLREAGGASIHDSGYGGTQTYKSFVFGALKGAHFTADKRFHFTDTVQLEVRSPVFELCDILQRSLENHPFMRLFDTRLAVVGASLANVHISEGRQLFATNSPVTVYRTESDGQTTFFAPDQPEFIQYLLLNFENKYTAIKGTKPEPVNIEILEPQRKIVTRFKQTWINCYKGRYAVTGSSPSLEFIYNAGLGVKNSQGFGMLDLL